MPYGPLALTVPRGPVATLGYEPRAAVAGFLAGVAPATAGMTRQSVQALSVMRRVSTIADLRGLENVSRRLVGEARLSWARSQRRRELVPPRGSDLSGI
jgi:hypothetical protein